MTDDSPHGLVMPSFPCAIGEHGNCPTVFDVQVPCFDFAKGETSSVKIEARCFCLCHGTAVYSGAVN